MPDLTVDAYPEIFDGEDTSPLDAIGYLDEDDIAISPAGRIVSPTVAPPSSLLSPGKINDDPQLADFDAWRTYCYQDKSRYVDWGSPLFNEALFGAQKGTSILIAGMPNHGKSILLTSLHLQLLEKNDDIVIIDFTLDDPKNKRLTQYAANLAHLEMNAVDFANTLDPSELKRWNDATAKLYGWLAAKKLYLFEQTGKDAKGKTILQADISFIGDTIRQIATAHPDKKVLIGLDALNNVRTRGRETDEYVLAKLISDEIEAILNETGALLLATSHLRKNSGRRPELDDLKGNNALAYAAKCVIGIFNDQKINKSDATVTWIHPTTGEYMPIVECHFLKSKISSMNSCIPLYQVPAWGRVQEPTPQEVAVFLAQIYGKGAKTNGRKTP